MLATYILNEANNVQILKEANTINQRRTTILLKITQLLSEMGIYRDNLSAIVIGDNFLPIIVIAQNSVGLSINDIAFAIYFVIADKLSR